MPPCIKQLPTFKSKNRKLGSFLFRSCLNKVDSKYSEIFQQNGTSAQINGGGGKALMTNGATNSGGNTQVR